MCHQCRICPVPWLGCPYISKVTMTSVMTMTLMTMSLSATTTKMPGTIVTEACCQRDGHPSTFPLIMWTIYWHACGGCRTQPIAWCQIPRTFAGLSLTPSPFAKAGRLYMGPWGLWGCWHCCEPHAFHHHLSSGLGLSAAGTGKLDEKYAGCLIQWWALQPAADQALHSPQMWGPGTALASSLSR